MAEVGGASQFLNKPFERSTKCSFLIKCPVVKRLWEVLIVNRASARCSSGFVRGVVWTMGIEILHAGYAYRIFTRFSPTAYLVCAHPVLYFARLAGNRTSGNTEHTREWNRRGLYDLEGDSMVKVHPLNPARRLLRAILPTFVALLLLPPSARTALPAPVQTDQAPQAWTTLFQDDFEDGNADDWQPDRGAG